MEKPLEAYNLLWKMDYKDISEIFTKRLHLRRFTPKDAKDVFEFASDKTVTRYVTWPAHESLTDSVNVINDYYIPRNTLAIVYGGKVIGSIDLNKKADGSYVLGYILNKKYWSRGIMTEAAKALIDEVFNKTDIKKITATHDRENIASGRVMEKCGFTYVKTVLSALEYKGRAADVVHRELIKK